MNIVTVTKKYLDDTNFLTVKYVEGVVTTNTVDTTDFASTTAVATALDLKEHKTTVATPLDLKEEKTTEASALALNEDKTTVTAAQTHRR